MQSKSLLLLLVGFLGQGQAPGAKDPGEKKEVLERFRREAAGYEIRLDADGPQKLTLREAPILHWGNPVRNEDAGAAFVWLHRGRPEVVGTVFTYKFEDGSVRMCHEFHSLAATSLTADYQGHRVWFPASAGIELKPVPNAPAPGQSAPMRLSQMRSLAREFTASSKDYKGRVWELRLLPQPLYRYEPTSEYLLDGALFAFCVGTDPELLLVIEARPHDGNPQWHFALARFSDAQLWVQHKEREVWRVPASPAIQGNIMTNPTYQQQPYVCFHPRLISGVQSK